MKNALLCFFGMNRSLSHTIDSISQNVILPLTQGGFQVEVVSALMRPVGLFSNQRSCEEGLRPEDNFEKLINTVRHEYIDQESFDSLVAPSLEQLKLADHYGDGHASTRNIVRELFSIKRAWLGYLEVACASTRPEIIIFLRPDLLYQDRLRIENYIPLLEQIEPRVMTPFWQKWGGLNDRFAICNFGGAEVYGLRYNYFWQYATLFRDYLQAESMLLATLYFQGVNFSEYTSEMAIRVRADGRHQDEAHGECGDNQRLVHILKGLKGVEEIKQKGKGGLI